jgi:hypothetical protein
MGEANYVRPKNDIRLIAQTATVVNEIWQLPDGRAGYLKGQAGASVNDLSAYETDGQVTVTKPTTFAHLDGGRVFWNQTTNLPSFRKQNARDFYIGRAVGDSLITDTAMTVNLNVDPIYDIDLVLNGFLSVPTGTQAVGGFGFPKVLGGSNQLDLSATSEAQCIDLFSVDRFEKGAKAIVEAIFRLPTNGASSASVFNVGLATATNTADAQSITEQCLVQVAGGSLAINAQSKDGTTTVAPTDTTVAATAGSAVANRVEVWIDTRNLASVRIYINGVRVLSGSTFRLDNATGPFGILAHLRKTIGTNVTSVVVDRLVARLAQQ